MTAEKPKRTWLKRLWKIFLWLFVLQFLYIIFCKWINPPITITQSVSVITGNGLKRDYISYDDMGQNIKLAVMAGEDQLFPDHDGFDIKAIKKAMKYNEKHPNKTRGASTISQQTAKNVFLWQHGGYFRKGAGSLFHFHDRKTVEQRANSANIPECSEMGPGIFGVQAAARAYFNKDAKNLTRQEAAMIAACLPNPKKFTVKPLSRYVAVRSGNLLRQMNNLEGDPDIQELIK